MHAHAILQGFFVAAAWVAMSGFAVVSASSFVDWPKVYDKLQTEEHSNLVRNLIHAALLRFMNDLICLSHGEVQQHMIIIRACVHIPQYMRNPKQRYTHRHARQGRFACASTSLYKLTAVEARNVTCMRTLTGYV
jgi:hypothetical protein